MNALDEKSESKILLGLWLYLMSDLVFFGVFFAVYAVLIQGTAGGVGPSQIIDLPFALKETLALLASSLFFCLGMGPLQKGKKTEALLFFALAWVLGAFFLFLQMTEAHHLLSLGHSWTASAFLSSYFLLLCTHSLHIFIGLLLFLLFLYQFFFHRGPPTVLVRFKGLQIFWIFLYFVWIFVFSCVDLMGVIR